MSVSEGMATASLSRGRELLRGILAASSGSPLGKHASLKTTVNRHPSTLNAKP